MTSSFERVAERNTKTARPPNFYTIRAPAVNE